MQHTCFILICKLGLQVVALNLDPALFPELADSWSERQRRLLNPLNSFMHTLSVIVLVAKCVNEAAGCVKRLIGIYRHLIINLTP